MLARVLRRNRIADGLLRAEGLRAIPRLLRARKERLSLTVRLHAGTEGDRLAVADADRALTYRELDRRIDRVAHALRDRLGVGRGDAVLFALGNRIELLEVQMAAARLGARVVAASWRSTPDELRWPLTHAEVRAAFVDDGAADALAALPTDVLPADARVLIGGDRPGFRSFEALVADAPETPVTGDDEAAVVVYTSGTTGTPKGAVRRFQSSAVDAYLRILGETPIRHGDRHLAVAPLYHSTAFAFVHLTFLVGGTVILERRFEPRAFLDAVARHRITTTAVVPTMLRRLLEAPAADDPDTSSLTAVFTGGGPLPPDVGTAFLDRFGPVLFNFYGATETGINTIASPEDLRRAPGCIGHVVPGNRLRLVDDDGREVPDGQVGALQVRNAMLIDGYHRNPEATARANRGGWFTVGDRARRDPETGLWFHEGRGDDTILSGGVNVYPAEVEAALRDHPAIADVAVVGAPDADLGERVVAFVVPADAAAEIDADALDAFARAHLSGPKRPRAWHAVDALPHNATGKLLRRALRARLGRSF